MLTLQVQPVTFTYNTINTDSEASHEGRFHLRRLESLSTEREEGGLELSLIHELSSSLPIRAQCQWGLTNQRTKKELIILSYQSPPTNDTKIPFSTHLDTT